MTILSKLIRKRADSAFATAIPAIPAIRQATPEGTVARIATIAVAKSPSGEATERLKPKPDPWRATRCNDCIAFKRIDHPHLGHCARGEPEAIAGLWDTDLRHCEQYQGIQKRGD